MHTYLISPLAPLVLRTGKPFGATGGGDSYQFPLPSTISGAFRTICADHKLLDFKSNTETIRSWTCHGALPAELASDGRIEPMFPRPADAFYMKRNSAFTLQQMTPEEPTKGEGSDLPNGLWPVFLETDQPSKPYPGPIWWKAEAVRQWLQGETPKTGALGPAALPVDMRNHVALDPATLAANRGCLFQSSGPDFEARRIDPESRAGCGVLGFKTACPSGPILGITSSHDHSCWGGGEVICCGAM